jgi:hypothetical protein
MKLPEIIELAEPDYSPALAGYIKEWLFSFLSLDKAHPLPEHHPGYISLSEAFWLYRLAKDIAPASAVESGTMHGYSAWWIAQALPDNGKLVSYDPTCNPIVRLTQNWRHVRGEFETSSERFDFAFFDDHVHQGRRLTQAAFKCIKHLVFHDVVPKHTSGPGNLLWHLGNCPEGTIFWQPPVLRAPEPFLKTEACQHRWLTYLRLP